MHEYTIDEIEIALKYFKDLDSGIMIDVGAHYGSTTIPFLKKGWQVIAYEPDPDNREVLISILKGFENITIRCEAVSDKSGKVVSFYASDESTGISGLSAFTDGHEKKCDVTTTTLIDELASLKINHVDFLKIDTEGFDLFVLKGFPWKEIKPQVIICEFEDLKTEALGYRYGDMADYLLNLNYDVFISEWHPIERYAESHSWKSIKKYPCSLENVKGWGNIIALRNKIDLIEIKKLFEIKRKTKLTFLKNRLRRFLPKYLFIIIKRF